MLTQDMTDGIGHIPAVHILQLVISCSHSNPPYAYTFRALMACSLQHASHSFHPLGNRRGPSGSPGFNMPTRQLVSAHSAASNHSPAPPNNSRVDTPKVSTRDWLAPPSNAAHLPTLGEGCTGKRQRHPVFTRVAGQYSLFGTGRFTNFRYWESLTRLLDYKVFINLRDLRFCLEKTSPT